MAGGDGGIPARAGRGHVGSEGGCPRVWNSAPGAGGKGMPAEIRGHHLLCALGFRGFGYSPAFAANMAAILGRLDAAPATPVRAVDGPDGICAGFPADQPGHCLQENVVVRDRRVIAGMGLRVGDVVPWGELRRRLGEAFAPEDLDALCVTCPWLPLGYCQEGLGRLRGGDGAGRGGESSGWG